MEKLGQLLGEGGEHNQGGHGWQEAALQQAKGWMGGAGGGAVPEEEGVVADRVTGGAGSATQERGFGDRLVGMAGQYLQGQEGGHHQGTPTTHQTAEGGGLSSQLMGMAGQYFQGQGGHKPEQATGMAGMAEQFLGGGGGGHAGAQQNTQGGGIGGMMMNMVGGGGNQHGEGGGMMSAGLVDKLLAMFHQQEGKPFTGQGQDFDVLHSLAGKVMGTSVGRSMVEAAVRQRLGF